MPRTQPTVLDVTWNWRQPESEPSSRGPNLRSAAIIQSLVMGAVALVLFYGLGHALAAKIVAALAGIICALGLIAPAAYRPIHGFGQLLGRVVGTFLVYVLLVPFFYLFFLPVALILRMQGRDPLKRKFRDARWTYWVGRQARPRGHNINKQFLQEDRQARYALREVGSLPQRDTEVGS